MKAFYIVCNFDLVVKPDWLDNFRSVYDDPNRYHLTLKNTTYMENGTAEDIKERVQKLAATIHPIKIAFRDVFHNMTNKGECIMLRAEEGKNLEYLRNVQRNVREMFEEIGKHIKPSYLTYEQKFNPHLTIGRHLSAEQFLMAWQEIRKYDFYAYCEVILDSMSVAFLEVEGEDEIRETKVEYDYKFGES